MKLLTYDNPKTKKGEKEGIRTFIMYLSPHKENDYGANLCKGASKGCADACLFGSGMGGMIPNVVKARKARTHFFLEDQKGFMDQLVYEIEKARKQRERGTVGDIAIRLNGTSDIPFEDIEVQGANNIFELFPDVQFYDYTKLFSRLKKTVPQNYYLTFSRNEVNDKRCTQALALGFNVAIVFDQLPENYFGYEVIDGDKSDLRFMEEGGKVIGLKYKPLTGKGAKAKNLRAKTSGFVVKRKDVEEKP